VSYLILFFKMITDMPLICETCLGGNPYIRMEKMGRAKLCNVTQLPYQGYRWRPANGRYKETVISSEVARSRNICQCCLNDLQFGLPVGVRDAMISVHSKQIAAPDSYVGSMVHYTQPQLAYSDGVTFADHVQNIVPTTQLDNFARKKYETQTNTQTAFRNLPKLCSFWLGGLCRRGDRCPFRPCNGTFVFPEIASDKEMHANLIALLNEKGAAALQVTLDKDIKTALKNALKGNSAESIRKRVRGNDDLTKKTLARVEDMVLFQMIYSTCSS
jgi:pre-mRNA-splicing factor RBM22/SLT11